jgi:hypothetical protein
MTENQRAPRFRVHGLHVVYDTGEEFWSGPVVNASHSGVFIETTHTLSAGTQVTVMPVGENDAKLPFEITGVVVRVDEFDLDNHYDRIPGIAMRFDGLSDAQGDQLRAFLKEHGALAD